MFFLGMMAFYITFKVWWHRFKFAILKRSVDDKKLKKEFLLPVGGLFSSLCIWSFWVSCFDGTFDLFDMLKVSCICLLAYLALFVTHKALKVVKVDEKDVKKEEGSLAFSFGVGKGDISLEDNGLSEMV